MRAVHHQLIRSLVSNSPQTAATLAETLDVSVRSIRTYVREINTSWPGILTSTPVGYTIDRNLAADVLKTDDGERFGSSKERSDYIVNHLIVQPDGDPIDLWDLCDEMSVSMSTLKTDLARAKRTLARNDLELVTHRDRISLNGTERNKRKLLSGMLRQETNNGFMGTGALSRAFPDIDIKSVQQLVSDTLYRHHRFINDYALSDLLLHLAISIDRIRRSESLDAGDTADLPEEDRGIACELADALGASLSIEFPAEELRELTLLIMARSTDIDYRSATESNLAELIGTDCMALVEKLAAQFNELYGIDLSDRGFLVRFGLHVRGLLVRARTQKPSRNPLTESVKTGCPLIYDAAVALASTITNDLGVTINDDEIAYIALHLGSAVGTQREADAKAKATIFCPSYYDMGPRLVEQLAGRFGEQLMITRIATDEAELTDCPDDLVICISPIQSVLQVPTLQIAPVPSSTDIANLRSKIEGILDARKRSAFKDLLHELIDPVLFEVRDDLSDRAACIEHMGRGLVDSGFADRPYIDKVFEREEMSSTAMGAFAMPHTVGLVGKHSRISVLISKKPIQWQDTQVNLVLMLCFSPAERSSFNTVFDRVAGSLIEPANIRRLLECTSYEAFVDALASLAN